MDCIDTKIKPDTDSRKHKNWERHARVITLLQRKHKTITQMAVAIDEYVPPVSACIWGIPGRQNPRIEEKIANFLDVTRIVPELEAGQWDADLGGGVYKQRIARAGAGKSGAYRLIIFFRSGERTFFEYGFAKSDRGNISKIQLKNLKKKAKSLLSLSEEQLKLLLATETYLEIKECKDETDVSE
jgi:hypothetical protein